MHGVKNHSPCFFNGFAFTNGSRNLRDCCDGPSLFCRFKHDGEFVLHLSSYTPTFSPMLRIWKTGSIAALRIRTQFLVHNFGV